MKKYNVTFNWRQLYQVFDYLVCFIRQTLYVLLLATMFGLPLLEKALSVVLCNQSKCLNGTCLLFSFKQGFFLAGEIEGSK